MRCLSCDCNLNDFESTRKSATTEEYLDLCSKCLDPIIDDIEVIEREDLRVHTTLLTDDEDIHFDVVEVIEEEQSE